jgi:predicted lactoylglutathione lyase
MTTTGSRKLFVNLAVHDLPRTKAFFAKLGFGFNPQFTNDEAACMPISEDAFVMLLRRERFQDFTRKEICDTSRYTEGLFALSCESRAEVDAMLTTALAEGATEATDPQDHGFMYVRTFYDLDGHHWEIMWMDPAAIQQ